VKGLIVDKHERSPLVFLSPSAWKDYALLDSGAGRKLERFGQYTFIRPEPQAFWSPALPQQQWDAADATFEMNDGEDKGNWQCRHPLDARWIMRYKTLSFWARTTPFRHLGVFPEQATQWDWISDIIKQAERPVKVLNLFGYTALATLAAAEAGAAVTHIDASRPALTWARENQQLSGLEDRPVRWIQDDALKFLRREVRRGARYDGFIIDPPKFGHGPKGEIWKLYEFLPDLLKACRALLSDHPLFAVLTAYGISSSALSLRYALAEMFAGYDGLLTAGEMGVVEQSGGRLLSSAIFARWAA
jgi:23S rRNA (cytosine1962-C5)-methyltransferase